LIQKESLFHVIIAATIKHCPALIGLHQFKPAAVLEAVGLLVALTVRLVDHRSARRLFV